MLTPSQEEIICAIQNLKNNKAPGNNGIHSELMKKRDKDSSAYR
jgi:hypothetical protein